MADPLVRSRPCPEGMMPNNCRLSLARAQEKGWETNCTIAIGQPSDDAPVVQRIVLRIQKDGQLAYGSWENGAWSGGRISPEWLNINYTELTELIMGGAKKPTPKELAKRLEEMQQMMAAIDTLSHIGYVLEVVPAGTADRWCKDCSRPAVNKESPLCEGPCRSEVR